MFVHHRFAVGVCVVAGVVAAGVGLHAAAAPPPAAGASFSWGPSPPPSPNTDSGVAVPGAPIRAAPPVPPPASSLGGLQLPLSGLFQQLNRETESTAVGQFAILRDIGNAIRDRVVGFLQWVSGGR